MKKRFYKNFTITFGVCLALLFASMTFTSENVRAGSYNGRDLALAILKNESTLISSSYTDTDESGHRQAIVLSSLGTLRPTDGTTFALLSTGIAGTPIVTTDATNPGDERGTWFGSKYGNPRDSATLVMTLKVPLFMHYLYYDVQFLSAEYPEYVGTKYNDKLTITVNSPSKGTTQYKIDVNSGYFVLNSNSIPGTGFDIFAQSGNPADVDIVNRTPRTPGADGGASDLIPIGGATHPVSPNETVTVTINIKDEGDNQFDSGGFIDNLRFSGFAQTKIVAIKSVEDLDGGEVESNDTLRYSVTISNTGTVRQINNPGNEFEDYIPNNTTYVLGSAYAQYGTISYDAANNKIIWNGDVPAETSRILEFKVKINQSTPNGALISNQGKAYWDRNEDGINDAIELTDDIHVNDDGIDQDGDGETGDDDPTNIYVFAYDYPSYVTEDFSDDTPYGTATQCYLGRKWFETRENSACGSCFEVAPSYHYSSAQSFKTKLRQSDGPQYWNYSLSTLEGNLSWWEIWFACGDVSEAYDLSLNFKNSNGQDIAKIKLNYFNNGSKPLDWVLQLCYFDPVNGWTCLESDYPGGYLRNSWYKIRIEKNGTSSINYILSRSWRGVVDSATGGQLSAPFSNLKQLEWSTTKEPAVCPMFFWDEHRIGLTY